VRFSSRLALCAIALAGGASVSHATTITYTLTGTGGNGSFAGTTFSGRNFTLVGVTDTANTTTLFGLPALTLTSMTYNIAGITAGPATTTATFFLVKGNSSNPNWLFFTNPTGISGTGFTAAGVSAWNMTSDFGPVASTQLGNFGGTITDQGVLVFSTPWTSATFTAVTSSAAPEPGTLALLALGATGLALTRRRQH
jgi:uncharacterized membrane protein YuzA (DUF378 family)